MSQRKTCGRELSQMGQTNPVRDLSLPCLAEKLFSRLRGHTFSHEETLYIFTTISTCVKSVYWWRFLKARIWEAHHWVLWHHPFCPCNHLRAFGRFDWRDFYGTLYRFLRACAPQKVQNFRFAQFGSLKVLRLPPTEHTLCIFVLFISVLLEC
jgi:hypothetical protein